MSDIILVDDRARPSTVCSFCLRLHSLSRRSCEAFPKKLGIPDKIWLGKHHHKKSFPGDGGKQFVLLGESRPERAR